MEGIVSEAHNCQQTGTAPATTAEEEIRPDAALFLGSHYFFFFWLFENFLSRLRIATSNSDGTMNQVG